MLAARGKLKLVRVFLGLSLKSVHWSRVLEGSEKVRDSKLVPTHPLQKEVPGVEKVLESAKKKLHDMVIF